MGYRSDVVIAVANKAMSSDLKEALIEVFVEQKRESSYTVYRAEWIKWYAGLYSEVDKIENLLSALDDEDYGFIRVGEDYTDIDLFGHPFEYGLYVNVNIEIEEIE